MGKEHGGDESKEGNGDGYAELDHALALDGRDFGDAGDDIWRHPCCEISVGVPGLRRRREKNNRTIQPLKNSQRCDTSGFYL